MAPPPPAAERPWLRQPRDAVVVDGPGAARYLQSQSSQDLAELAVGQATWTFLLDPTGKVVALARVARHADQRFVLDTDAGFGEVLEARLRRFMIRVDATLTRQAIDGKPGAGEAERLESRWPRMGAEIVPGETIPAETGVVAEAVSFTKGCYPGQELVERMDARGAVARRHLDVIDVSEGAAPGDVVQTAPGPVTLTSVVGRRGLGWRARRTSEPGPPGSLSGTAAGR